MEMPIDLNLVKIGEDDCSYTSWYAEFGIPFKSGQMTIKSNGSVTDGKRSKAIAKKKNEKIAEENSRNFLLWFESQVQLNKCPSKNNWSSYYANYIVLNGKNEFTKKLKETLLKIVNQ